MVLTDLLLQMQDLYLSGQTIDPGKGQRSEPLWSSGGSAVLGILDSNFLKIVVLLLNVHVDIKKQYLMVIKWLIKVPLCVCVCFSMVLDVCDVVGRCENAGESPHKDRKTNICMWQ